MAPAQQGLSHRGKNDTHGNGSFPSLGQEDNLFQRNMLQATPKARDGPLSVDRGAGPSLCHLAWNVPRPFFILLTR